MESEESEFVRDARATEGIYSSIYDTCQLAHSLSRRMFTTQRNSEWRTSAKPSQANCLFGSILAVDAVLSAYDDLVWDFIVTKH